MADRLPNMIAFRSIRFSTPATARFEEGRRRGIIRVSGNSVRNELVKIQVEPSKVDSRYVHFRFVHVNKYWAKPADDRYLLAGSDQPEEDITKPSCTLFQPTFDANGNLGLIHVHTMFYIERDIHATIGSGNAGLLFALNTAPNFTFTFVDLESIVTLPMHVAFKGHNDRYVQAITFDRLPYNQTSSGDPNDGQSNYEVQHMEDGHIRIKSLHFDRYWRRSPNWIWADNNSTSGSDRDTLFWPVQIDDNTIALRNAGNNLFIRPLTLEGKTNCLNARVANMTLETRLVVEELVLQRDIFNVRYRMEDARIYDEQPFLAGVATATNLSAEESTLDITISYEDSFSYSFSNSLSITQGVSTKIQAGIPKIASGKIRISTEISKEFEWNRTTEEKKIVTAEHGVTVPPKSRARVSYVGTHGKCSLPFNYTRRDKRSTSGDLLVSQHIDGIYSGVSYYNFQFEVLEFEPLSSAAN